MTATDVQNVTVDALSFTAADSIEVGVHELGESLALSLGAIQAELASYGGGMGSFIMDDFTLEIPLRLRIDALGQAQATVVTDTEAGVTYTRLNLKVRPVVGAVPSPLPMLSHKSLSVLRVVPEWAIQRLAEFRVFSAADFRRVASRPASVQTLRSLDIDVDTVLDSIAVLELPVDPRVAEALLALDITSLARFLEIGPEELAERLTSHLGQPVDAADIKTVQEDVREAMRLRFRDSTRDSGELRR
jgi:hypothetical protein